MDKSVKDNRRFIIFNFSRETHKTNITEIKIVASQVTITTEKF